MIVPLSYRPSRKFLADRPFLYAIRHNVGVETSLFMGSLSKVWGAAPLESSQDILYINHSLTLIFVLRPHF